MPKLLTKGQEFNNCSELLYYHRYCAFSLSRTTVEKKEILKVKYIFTLWSTIKSDSLTDGVMNVTILVEGFIITSNRVILSAFLFL